MITKTLPSLALPWPLPALLAWAAAWLAWALALALGLSAWPAWLVGLGVGALAASRSSRLWRRALVVAGFPLSALATGLAVDWPAWAWLFPVAVLLFLYPVRAWRDAPYFPTPSQALVSLAQTIGPAPERVLDAGCGLGHGLAALRELWPQARIDGLEWSRPLSWLAAWRCPWAQVRRGDMWAADWSPYGLVYLFQRPESMARAHRKAQAEMREGSWLVSLEFEVPGQSPRARLGARGQRSVWVYRMGDPAPAAGNTDSTAPLARR